MIKCLEVDSVAYKQMILFWETPLATEISKSALKVTGRMTGRFSTNRLTQVLECLIKIIRLT